MLQLHLTFGKRVGRLLGQIAAPRIERLKFLQSGIDVKYTDNRR
ncbi:MAG: hypothetical protein ABSG14_06695 [Verrucomicrobiia bacterium]